MLFTFLVEPKLHPGIAEPIMGSFEFKAVLLVDDDRQLAETLQWILADENFMVDVAFDGNEALAKVKANDYDAIVCDMMMPNVRGDQFYANALHLKPSLVNRFLFMTGHMEIPEVANFFKTERVRCLTKPFPVRRLVDEIRQVVRLPQLS